ncbi:MAG: dihydrofolate reductase family protein [Nitrososphaeraceae archaeon]
MLASKINNFSEDEFKLGDDGETGVDDKIVEVIFNRIGANIIGMRLFEEGEANWPEDAPFHTPVFVLTLKPRSSWQRKGGTTFYFVNDGVESALQQARQVAGGNDIRIVGVAQVIQQYLNAGLVDEFTIHYAPLFLDQGTHLFDRIDKDRFSVQIMKVVHSPLVTHLQYKLMPK